MTKHVFGVYSSEPGSVTPPPTLPAPVTVPVVAEHDGPATVAAYSVVHDRAGGATHALLVCDLAGGARTYATLTDLDECRRAEEEELVGESVLLRGVRVDGAFGPGTVNRAELQR